MLDMTYAWKMGLVIHHWSNKHRQVVQGINLLTLLRTDGAASLSCDHRLDEQVTDQLSKNGDFHALLATAQTYGFVPASVIFGRWYACLENLKAIRGHGWRGSHHSTPTASATARSMTAPSAQRGATSICKTTASSWPS